MTFSTLAIRFPILASERFMKNSFAEWITKRYLAWQAKIGERRSVAQFAEYLDVSQPSLSNWMSGKYVPKDALNINKLYDRLGPEVFDVLGLDRPIFAREELLDDMREFAHAIHELPAEYQTPTRNMLIDILRQAVKDSKDELVPKRERLSSISDDALKNAADAIKKAASKPDTKE